VIAIIGTIAAVRTLGGDTPSAPQAGTSGTAAPGRPTSTGEADPVQIPASSVRIVAPVGDRDNAEDARNMVDGDTKTKWRTQKYLGAANFGNLEKKGLGVLVDLGKETAVSAVQLDLGAAGADVQLLGGATDPGNSREGDLAITTTYKPISEKKENAPTRLVLPGEPNTKVRYLLVWFTKLPLSPADGSNNFRLEVLELTVLGQQSS
jgi:hypothetical protein